MQELPPTEDCWQTKSCPHHKAMLLLPLDNLRCELPGGCNRRVFVVKLSTRDAASHSSKVTHMALVTSRLCSIRRLSQVSTSDSTQPTARAPRDTGGGNVRSETRR